jgi:hypothetical protein
MAFFLLFLLLFIIIKYILLQDRNITPSLKKTSSYKFIRPSIRCLLTSLPAIRLFLRSVSNILGFVVVLASQGITYRIIVKCIGRFIIIIEDI